MSEFKDQESAIWRLAEGIIIGVATIIALGVSLVTILIEIMKGWINDK